MQKTTGPAARAAASSSAKKTAEATCYQNGEFTEPDLTFEEMIEKTVHFMTTHLDMSEEEADRRARSIIPNLERWRE